MGLELWGQVDQLGGVLDGAAVGQLVGVVQQLVGHPVRGHDQAAADRGEGEVGVGELVAVGLGQQVHG